MFKDTVQITTTSITDEQTDQLLAKLNEKYKAEEVANEIANSTENETTDTTTTTEVFSKEDLTVSKVPHMQLRDIIMPIVINLIIAICVTLIYVIIRYHKLGKVKVFIECLVYGIIIPQALVFSIVAITRLPMGRLTLPIILITYILGITIFVSKKEKQLDELIVIEE
ncbi:hypothetical protein D3C72_1182560 [compost metagenome]